MQSTRSALHVNFNVVRSIYSRFTFTLTYFSTGLLGLTVFVIFVLLTSTVFVTSVTTVSLLQLSAVKRIASYYTAKLKV